MATVTEDHTILIAIDGSDQAEAAFEFYHKWLHRPNHKLLLLHSVEPPYMSGSHAAYISFEAYQELLAEKKEKAKVLEAKYEGIFQQHNLTGTFRVVVHPNAGEAIVNEAKDSSARMVIMGTRGLGTIRRTIMGSVSDYVVHHIHCPILVFRL